MHHRPGTELVKVQDTDLFYSVYFYDIAFSDDEINENVNYDSDYDEGLMMNANYPEQSKLFDMYFVLFFFLFFFYFLFFPRFIFY